MSKETKPKPKAGDMFHFLVTGHTFMESTRGSAGMVSLRTMEMTVTDDLIAAGRDKFGDCWLDLLHDPEGQKLRWGQVVFAPGPFPASSLPTVPGTAEHEDARRDAIRVAQAIGDDDQRRKAVRNVEEVYGPSGPTSRTLAVYGPS